MKDIYELRRNIELGKPAGLWKFYFNFEIGFWKSRMCPNMECDYSTMSKKAIKNHIESNCHDWNGEQEWAI